MNFNDYLLVALGGGLGSGLRAYVGSLPFLNVPWGTFAVNVAGCFLIGLLIKLLGEGKPLYFLLVAGFCGGFTTFSAFGLETVELLGKDNFLPALENVALTLISCLAAVYFGHQLAGS